MKDLGPGQWLLITRHARRDKHLGHAFDNGLNEKGVKQGERLGKFFRERLPLSEAVFLSSPRKRCVETLERMLSKLDTPNVPTITVDLDLDEEGDLTTKVESFRRRWFQSEARLTVICSHGDWIPTALAKWLGIDLELEKGAFALIRRDGRGLRLVEILQILPR